MNLFTLGHPVKAEPYPRQGPSLHRDINTTYKLRHSTKLNKSNTKFENSQKSILKLKLLYMLTT